MIVDIFHNDFLEYYAFKSAVESFCFFRDGDVAVCNQPAVL